MSETAYHRFVGRLREACDRDAAMHAAIGGEFAAFGALECALLAQVGMRPDDYLIDVGCGSGRLAVPLAATHTGRYLGTDIVPALCAYAEERAARPDWRFAVVETPTIPEADNAADWVCFFSVLTHLPHEVSYAYLREAVRVLRPGGRIVFSFLDFALAAHWPTFEAAVANIGLDSIPTVFIGRDAIHAWTTHLDLTIERVVAGTMPFIPLPAAVTTDTGARWEGMRPFGQSVCVLTKPPAAPQRT